MARNPLSWHLPTKTIGVFLEGKSYYLEDHAESYKDLKHQRFYDPIPNYEVLISPECMVTWK